MMHSQFADGCWYVRSPDKTQHVTSSQCTSVRRMKLSKNNGFLLFLCVFSGEFV